MNNRAIELPIISNWQLVIDNWSLEAEEARSKNTIAAFAEHAQQEKGKKSYSRISEGPVVLLVIEA